MNNKLIKWQCNNWQIHCLGEIDTKWTDKSRLVSSVMVPWGIRKIISAYETTLIDLRKDSNQIDCYPSQRMVSIDICKIKRVIWDGANNLLRSTPENDSF